jgi:hypothetical protein
MGELVADHRADAAEVHGIVDLRVEERRLQNPRREHDLGELRRVVGVDRGRRHVPLGLVHWLAELRVVPLHLERVRAAHVAGVIVAPYDH